jgi:hypothetical protein
MSNSDRWEVLGLENGETHVMPIGDMREHDESPNCWCCPWYDESVWVHISIDRREIFERRAS